MKNFTDRLLQIIFIAIICLTSIFVYKKCNESSHQLPEYKILRNFTLTAYCPCTICNGKYTGKLYDGTLIKTAKKICNIIAVDPKVIRMGSIVEVHGILYRAWDVGSAIKGKRIDILLDTHTETIEFGIKKGITIKVYE